MKPLTLTYLREDIDQLQISHWTGYFPRLRKRDDDLETWILSKYFPKIRGKIRKFFWEEY